MQMDTGSEVTITQKNFWERIGKPTLRKSNLQLLQFENQTDHVRHLIWLEWKREK